MTSSAAVNTTTRLGTRVRANVFRTSRHIERARPARAGGPSFNASRCLALAKSLTGNRTVFMIVIPLPEGELNTNYKFGQSPRRFIIGHQNIGNLNADSFVSDRRSQCRIARIEYYIIQEIMVAARNPRRRYLITARFHQLRSRATDRGMAYQGADRDNFCACAS